MEQKREAGSMSTESAEAEVRSGRPRPQVSSRRHQVVDYLRQDIMSGLLVPGAQLKQDLIGQEFAVSPGPVREALRQLESEGLVVHIPNRGVFVGEVTPVDLLGVLLPVRLAIETYAAEQLEGREETLTVLQGIVDQMRRAANAGVLQDVNDLDLKFHETLVRSAQSTHALQIWNNVQPRIRMQIYKLSARHSAIHAIPQEHQELVDVFRSNDRDLIRDRVEDHIVGSAQRLLLMEEQNVTED